MPRGERLVQCMRQAANKSRNPSKNTDIVFGVVQNTSPLTVLVDNRLELTEEFLILSPFNSHTHSISVDTVTQSSHQHDTDTKPTQPAGGFDLTPSASAGKNGGHRVNVTLWDNLVKGDKLVMLRVKEGQEYLILYRDRLKVKASCQDL